MKDYIICLGFWIVVAGQAFGQKAMIKGQVSSEKKEPLAGANVILKGTVRGVQTNSQGEYIIKGLSSGTYTIEVSFLGFKNKTISFLGSNNSDRRMPANEPKLARHLAIVNTIRVMPLMWEMEKTQKLI